MYVSPKLTLLVNVIPGQSGSDVQAPKCCHPTQRPRRFADSNLPSSPALVLPPLTRQPQLSPPFPMCPMDGSDRVDVEGFGSQKDLGVPPSGCESLPRSLPTLISHTLAGLSGSLEEPLARGRSAGVTPLDSPWCVCESHMFPRK